VDDGTREEEEALGTISGNYLHYRPNEQRRLLVKRVTQPMDVYIIKM